MIPAEETNGPERLEALLDRMKQQNAEPDPEATEAAIEQGYRNLLDAIREQ